MSLAEEAALMMRAGMYWSTLLGLAQDLTAEDLKALTKVSSSLIRLAGEDPGHFSKADLDLIHHLPGVIHLLETIKGYQSSLERGWHPQPLEGGLGG